MALLGGGGRRERDEMDLRADLARLDGLPLDELADEVLRRLFGPGGRARDGVVPAEEALVPFDPRGTGLFPGMPKDLRESYRELVEEGVQRLEHRGLLIVRVTGREQTTVGLRLTRAGRRAAGEG
ncbi:MAG TPA: hypothetical protein PKD59_03130 [Miltoncostaeaceae bacterium]|nr:hypothetical protein [Miltoncostaeaceae bacterium]